MATLSSIITPTNVLTSNSTNTVSNKTISLGSNTVSGTLAQFNAAVTDADLASLAGAEALSNKTIALGSNTISGTKADFDTAVTDDNFAYVGTANSFTKPQRPSLSTETAPTTNTITWDLTTDQILRINLNANITTFNLTGTLSSLAGNQYQVLVRYNGGTAITWNANIKWPVGTAPTLTGTSGKVDTFTFVVSSTDGTNYYLLNTGKTQNL